MFIQHRDEKEDAILKKKKAQGRMIFPNDSEFSTLGLAYGKCSLSVYWLNKGICKNTSKYRRSLKYVRLKKLGRSKSELKI